MCRECITRRRPRRRRLHHHYHQQQQQQQYHQQQQTIRQQQQGQHMLPRCHDPRPVATTAFDFTSRNNFSIMSSFISNTTTTVVLRTALGLCRCRQLHSNFGSPRPPRRWQLWPMRRTD